jgi:hypothetical protein
MHGFRGWQQAKAIVQGIKLSEGFTTLRDQCENGYIHRFELELLKKLGEGAFATVELSKFGGRKMVAVKTLKKEILEDSKEVCVQPLCAALRASPSLKSAKKLLSAKSLFHHHQPSIDHTQPN